MSEQKINPHQVTKPIQLLAAWLVGLILINSSFLGAAHLIEKPDWAAGLLVIAAVLNVPIFLVLIFFLQTKFRAELQEDTFYSKHLEKVTGETKSPLKSSNEFLSHLKIYESKNDNKLQELSKNIESIASTISANKNTPVDVNLLFEKLNQAKNTLTEAEIIKSKRSIKIALNDLIDSYKDIAKELVKSGYKITDTFGSTGTSNKPPKNLTISFTDKMNKAALTELYIILKKYGFNRIDYDENPRLDEKAIYIGSYIDSFPETRVSLAISEEIESAILDEDTSIEQLGDLIVVNRA